MRKREIDKFIRQRKRVYAQIYTDKNADKFLEVTTELITKYNEVSSGSFKGKEVFQMFSKERLRRVYMGIATEFLLKALYLQFGYVINEVHSKHKRKYKGKHPLKFKYVDKRYLKRDKTVNFEYLIKHLRKVLPKGNYDYNADILWGLRLIQLLRNIAAVHTISSKDTITSQDDHLIHKTVAYIMDAYLKKKGFRPLNGKENG